ncbi:MAG: 5-3 exonuclease [Nocardioidaceae bacterium]|nr:5-3 exonuclease [Nocardioidaceae bacterium]
MFSRTLLAVDGNSLLHRSFHASARSGFHTADGRPMWAVRGLLSQLSAAVDRVCADAVVVGFDDPAASVRRERWPTYKGHRDAKPATLEDQLAAAVDVLRDLGVVVAVPAGLEADDVLASAAAYARSAGARTVLATSDRDSFSLIDDNTKVLRILNGGVDASPLLDPHRLAMVTGVRADQYLDLAALRGDASDNLPGVPGIGPKTAARLLAELGSARAAFDDAAAGGTRCRAALGAALTKTLAGAEAREIWEHNCAVMTMVADAPLGLDLDHGVGCLPLTENAVTATFRRLELHVPSAVRALTGKEPSVPRAVDVDASWRPATRRATMRHPRLPSKPRPAYVQETLF